jgi:hypothetical protein
LREHGGSGAGAGDDDVEYVGDGGIRCLDNFLACKGATRFVCVVTETSSVGENIFLVSKQPYIGG